MEQHWNRRNSSIIHFFALIFWPVVQKLFRIKVLGLEHLTQPQSKLLFVANHNSGALIESFSTLMILRDHKQEPIFGFTHPSIFKVPLIKQYFEILGAVPATYPVAKEVFDNDYSLMIFPGGNSQALRSVWEYKNNEFRNSHGWAKIAQENKATVIPITFQNTHFINPILVSGSWISKILVLPWILGLKKASISIGQILMATFIFVVFQKLEFNLFASSLLSYIAFNLTPLVPVLPVKIIIRFHPPIHYSPDRSQDQLEDKVQHIMNSIYA